ncbi:MAG: CheY-like chemotaxis protein [Myxococcota bacterium]|jgi:CheY-like chemotaxis protein
MAPLRSILLIDDSTDDNFIHATWLERTGAVASHSDIFIRENGQEALAFLRDWEENQAALGERFPPDLILLDINMPVLDGFGFLEALEKLSLDIDSVVMLMLTSSNSRRDKERAERFPWVRGYIEKPLTRKKIRHILEEHFPEQAD